MLVPYKYLCGFYFGGNMQEIWKDVKGYEELYQVSNLGNVKSRKGNEKILKPFCNTTDNPELL